MTTPKADEEVQSAIARAVKDGTFANLAVLLRAKDADERGALVQLTRDDRLAELAAVPRAKNADERGALRTMDAVRPLPAGLADALRAGARGSRPGR